MKALEEKIRSRLDELKEKYPSEKITQKWLAEKTGVSTAAVSKWLDGSTKTLKGDTLLSVAKALECSPEWLNGTGQSNSLRPIKPWDSEEELSSEEYVLIPRLDIKASCGNGNVIWEVDEKAQKQAFRRKWCERLGINPLTSATLMASGDSMNDRILDGDSLVIDHSAKNLLSGKVYLFSFNDEIYTKRLYKQKDSILVVSDNPNKELFPNWEINSDEMEQFSIIGRVVAVSGGM